MKNSIIITLAAALVCALPLALTSRASTSASDPVRVRVEIDRGVLPSESVERAIVKVALDCFQPVRRESRPPVNLSLVIDRSGSMGGDKIARACQAALEAVRRLGPEDVVSLVVFDNNAQTLVAAQPVGDGRRIEEAIRSIEPGGGTALYAGVTRGAAELRRNIENRRLVNRVILLSDGLANVGPGTPEELGRLGASLVKEGISVTTIGLGLGFNEDLMSRLAQCSDGNTYFVEDSADLPRIFAAELGDVLSVVARSVNVDIEFPSYVRPLSFVGREGTIRGQKAELTLNQLYGGQEKFALIEVEVSPSHPGTEREIASARVSYADAINQRNTTVTATRSVQFSASRTEVVASADHKVQADYAANVMAKAKDEAVALVDAGRRDQAAAVIRERASDMRAIGELYGNEELKKSAAAAAPEADRLAREGLDSAARKAYRTEAAQTVNQQSTSNR